VGVGAGLIFVVVLISLGGIFGLLGAYLVISRLGDLWDGVNQTINRHGRACLHSLSIW